MTAKRATPAKKARTRNTVYVDNLIGLIEIAAKFKVTVTTIWNWTKRYSDFPDPIAKVSRCPVWDWDEVHEWGKAAGKIK
jgi:predicted DNA-binding transcriptional regulator AlpA